MNDSRLEMKVGAFVLLGLLLIGALIVGFGKFDRYFQKTYEITVIFPNANGVIKNSNVLFRGAKIGWVLDRPQIAEGGRAVSLVIRIFGTVDIPKDSKFKVGDYGLLGDRYIDIVPTQNPSAEFIEPNATVQGEQNFSLSDIASMAKPIVERIDDISKAVQTRIITPEFTADLTATIKSTRGSMEKIDRLLAEAEKGNGAVSILLKDPAVAAKIRAMVDDASAFTSNIRKKGILFYKDVSDEPEKKPAPAKPGYQSR
jgi:phospholipid/cholesterol/gamma-HCH transport system substrate-binding protein